MGNKLRHEGDEVRIKVIWPDVYMYVVHIITRTRAHKYTNTHTHDHAPNFVDIPMHVRGDGMFIMPGRHDLYIFIKVCLYTFWLDLAIVNFGLHSG